MNVEAFRVRSKSANLEEAGKVALRFTLAECAKNITCPIYIVAGTKDRLTPHTQAEKLAATVSGRACCRDRRRQSRRQQSLVPLPRPDRRLDGVATRCRKALAHRRGPARPEAGFAGALPSLLASAREHHAIPCSRGSWR